MALSRPVGPNTDQEESVIGQDYLACGNEDCEKSCKYYCNPCHRPLCEECRDGHHENPKTKNHDVVSYIQRNRKLPKEKCRDHPTKDIDMTCEDCQILVCSKCATQNHRKHALIDLETTYSERFSFCLDKIYKVHQYFIPTSQGIQQNIKEDFKELKPTMDKIRTSMKAEAESLKCLVDLVISEKIEEVSKIEESLQTTLQSQDKTYQDYIFYLEELAKVFHGYLSSTKVLNNPIINLLDDHLTVQPIPKTTKLVPPLFTAGQYSKEDVTKLLGRVEVPDIKPENRKIKPMDTVSSQLKPAQKETKQDDHLTVQPIPKTTKLAPPLFTAGQYGNYDVAKLLGRVEVPDMKPENREIKPMDTVSSQLKPAQKETKQVTEKSGMKQALPLSSFVAKVREYTVPGVGKVFHLSLGKSGRLWSSDDQGNLVQTDQQGNLLQRIQTNGEAEGYHAVTMDGDLIYTDKKNEIIYRITQDNKINQFVKTEDWEPISIHSSHINGDILVGMIKAGEGEGKIKRYNKTGKSIQNIQGLYGYPVYITENINGDICTSDYEEQAVVVVNKSGQRRFSYTGQGSKFYPRGICTDLHGHILVCSSHAIRLNVNPGTSEVHLLDQDGQFLSLLLNLQKWVEQPRGLIVDDENNFHLGQYYTNTVTVYKYLQ